MNDKQPAKILFLIDKKVHCDRFAGLLSDLEFGVEWRWIGSLKELEEIQNKTPFDLLLYWHQRSIADDSELISSLESFEDQPSLILVADHIEPRDYIHASKLNAADVINSGMLAQFAFVVRRELASIFTRRKLVSAIDNLADERIMNESEFDTSVEVADMGGVIQIIDDALKNNKFELLFQPIVAVADDGYDNYEVFLRIRNKGDFMKPGDFIPVAEKYGLMPAIDRWVVQNAIKRYKAEAEVKRIRKQDNRQIRFFINLSGYSLVDEVIMGNIITEIVQAKLEEHSLVIEVDKNTVLSRLQKVKSLNQNVKKLKLEFAIDHYEESDNSLNYLKHISLDYMKINGTILNGLHKDSSKRDAVREIVRKARENDIRVIASQVEDAEDLPMLYGLGVDYIQGYLINEPSTRLEYQAMDATITGSIEKVVIGGDFS